MRLDLYENVDQEEILKAIGIKSEYVPRIRGVGIDDGKILIHTRTGGGNREQYDTVDLCVNGEYGLEDSLRKYKIPEKFYVDNYTPEELEKMIKETEERKELILSTKAYTNEYMTSNQYYLSNNDDDFDCTYADFWFRIPEEFTESLLKLEDKERKAVLGDAKIAIDLKLGNEKTRKEAVEKVNANLKSIGSDIIIPI